LDLLLGSKVQKISVVYQENSSQVKNHSGAMEMALVLKSLMPTATSPPGALVKPTSIKKQSNHGLHP